MKLTDEEEQIIYNRRQKQSNSPVKTGILKHDLYFLDHGSILADDLENELYTSFTLKEKQKFIKFIDKNIKLVLKTGTEISCIVPRDTNKEQWSDKNFSIIGDAEWAKSNLKNIKVVKS